MLTIFGCGRLKLHDGGVGVVVARRIARHLDHHPHGGVRVIDADVDGYDALLGVRGSDELIVVDATEEDEGPGEVTEVSAARLVLPPVRGRARPKGKEPLRWFHVLRACREMVGLPKERQAVTVFLIEAERTGAGLGLSPKVQAAVEPVCARILERIDGREGR